MPELTIPTEAGDCHSVGGWSSHCVFRRELTNITTDKINSFWRLLNGMDSLQSHSEVSNSTLNGLNFSMSLKKKASFQALKNLQNKGTWKGKTSLTNVIKILTLL